MITETSQYMTFKLGAEFFAINVAQVREALEVTLITKVSQQETVFAVVHIARVMYSRVIPVPLSVARISRIFAPNCL